MSKGIRVSEKYGVNPAIPVCFFCGKEKNMVILAGRMGIEDKEAPRHAVWDHEPCDECAEYMKQGVMLMSVRDGESGQNPYRTGRMAVVKEEAAKRMFNETICQSRFAFIEDSLWFKMGLPMEDIGGGK